MKQTIKTIITFIVLCFIFVLFTSEATSAYMSKQEIIIVDYDLPEVLIPKVDIRTYTAILCLREEIPFEIMDRLITKESNWNQDCISYNRKEGKVVSKDIGLMQLNSKYYESFIKAYKEEGTEVSDYDIKNNAYHNVYIGTMYLKDLYTYFGDWRKAVQAYNCGTGTVMRGRVPKSTLQYADYVLGTTN